MCKSTVDPNAKPDITQLTMYKQLAGDSHPPLFIKEVIYGYFKALHQMWGLPVTDEFVDIVLVGNSLDIKYEEDNIIFFNKVTNEILETVYAPC